MEADFWHERWRNNQIGFHQERVNDYLQRFYGEWGVRAGEPVLVPLCGKSLDMVWLRERGHPVIGVELSAIAVEAFFREHGLQPERRDIDVGRVYEAEGVRLYCADFFALSAADIGTVAAVYDRAALIALPPALRPRYVRQTGALLAPAARGFLVTMEYPDGQMQGPPFSVTEAEVNELYGSGYAVTRLADHDALADNARLRERGIASLHEKVYRFVRP